MLLLVLLLQKIAIWVSIDAIEDASLHYGYNLLHDASENILIVREIKETGGEAIE